MNDRIKDNMRRLEQMIASPTEEQVTAARRTLAGRATGASDLREVLYALDLMPSAH